MADSGPSRSTGIDGTLAARLSQWGSRYLGWRTRKRLNRRVAAFAGGQVKMVTALPLGIDVGLVIFSGRNAMKIRLERLTFSRHRIIAMQVAEL